MRSLNFAEWMALFSTASVVFTCGVVTWYTLETRHMRLIARRQADAAVLKQIYDYVIQTYPARRLVYRNAELIRSVRDLDDLERFRVEHEDVERAVHDVANCFHYIGFLMEQGLLADRRPFLREAGTTILATYEIVWPFIEIERRTRTGGGSYKRYFQYLVNEVRADPGSHGFPLAGVVEAPPREAVPAA